MTHYQAQRLMDDGSYFVYSNFHGKVDPKIPEKIQGLLDLKMAVMGSVDDIRRRLAEYQETLNPEYMLWLGDQGYLALDEMKRELELFATKVMPEFHERREPTTAERVAAN